MAKTHIQNLSFWKPPKGRGKMLRLDLNENIYAPSDKVIALVQKFGREVLNTYPEYDGLLQKISEYAGISSKNIFLSDGSEHGIETVIRALCQRNKPVAVPSPVFFGFYQVMNIEEVPILPIHFSYEKGKGWSFPYEETKKVLKESQALVLVNPNNPLGVLIPEDIMISLLKECGGLGIPVVIDEAYFEFCGKTLKDLVLQYPNLIIIRTFSKYFGLSGLRLGYVLADESHIQSFMKIRTPWAVNNFAVHAGAVVLDHKDEFKGICANIKDSRKDLYEFFLSSGIETWESFTNFVVIKTSFFGQIKQILEENGILVSDLSRYPHSKGNLSDALRITVPIGKDLSYFKEIFTKILKKM